MRVKVGFKEGDKVTYKTVTEERVIAVITAVFPPDGDRFYEEYEITVTTNRARTYRKGNKFRTSGNFLNKR